MVLPERRTASTRPILPARNSVPNPLLSYACGTRRAVLMSVVLVPGGQYSVAKEEYEVRLLVLCYAPMGWVQYYSGCQAPLG
eukprot:3275999-Rhodomonas_salina.1